ncbi:hypothetical protein A2U01_0076513, partial [Trifolium medium]|nr:hypothetical protein [Trifolium medium]
AKLPLNHSHARHASPRCAPRQRPKPSRLSQQERRVAPDASARHARCFCAPRQRQKMRNLWR